jgi:enoyl-CoA hydratase/carnithine racemase
VIDPENSRAAAVLADLLCEIEGLPIEQALIAESLAYGLLQGSSEHAAWLEQRDAVPVLPAGQVLIERAGGTLAITLDRPNAHNAIDRAMRDDLRAAFDIAANDLEVEKVILTARGKAFCTGADLSEFGTTRDPATAHAIRMATLPAHAIATCAGRLEVHIRGACIGAGLEMAAFARHIVAAPTAWFQLPELAMGLIPGAGGCVSVSRRIGAERMKELVLSGKRISAQTALDWGLVDVIAG